MSEGGIVFLGVSTFGSANAARFLSIFDSALRENRRLTLFYDDLVIAGHNFRLSDRELPRGPRSGSGLSQ